MEAGTAEALSAHSYDDFVQEICRLNWRALAHDELINVAWAYYYFSIQFRENLELARELYPDDEQLRELDRGERDTDNLSPWPGVASPGERMNHDEFMRRALALSPVDVERQRSLETLGANYLAAIQAIQPASRALSLASYEDGALASVFRAILTVPVWEGPLLQAFRHFLCEHIRLDSDPEIGHGALCRHMSPDQDQEVVALWRAFLTILIGAAPRLLV
jgi:hypothetical protein